MKGEICFCPNSIKWILKHLQKSARPGFRKILRGISPTKIISRYPKRKRMGKRRFSKKQLAAQRLFARRAKAGTLRRSRR